MLADSSEVTVPSTIGTEVVPGMSSSRVAIAKLLWNIKEILWGADFESVHCSFSGPMEYDSVRLPCHLFYAHERYCCINFFPISL